jgi:predicted ATP-grasp superfamily ATP-dependent carboligase
MLPFVKLSLAALLGLSSTLTPHGVRIQSRRTREVTDSVSSTPTEGFNGVPQQAPPVLLMRPDYYGTLAAVRTLGRAGIAVKTAGAGQWTMSGASKYSEASLVCPQPTDTEALLAWLDDFGRRNARHVLLPTCDDTAWLYARHREQLSKYFYLGPGEINAVHGLLHKGKLAAHARAVGLDTPDTWFPASAHDLSLAASQAHFPVLVKPTTQALYPARSKGGVVDNADDLPDAYAQLAALSHEASIVDYDPSSARPMVQEFFPSASERIYNISGYIRDGRLCCARAARKLLQQPRRLGVGVCFEEAPLETSLCSGLERLAQRVGFEGVFEAEFVRVPGRDVLIDFNPRFYNQMGFDVARGLPLPLLSYHDALRDHATFDRVCASTSKPAVSGKVFVHESVFKLMVRSQRLSGALSQGEAEHWLRWYAANADSRVDAVVDAEDAWPGRVDVLRRLRHHVRHPRQFVRSVLLNR